MSEQYKPQLGDRVTFSHHWERPTDDEVQARGTELYEADDVGSIGYQRRDNLFPDRIAYVTDITRRTATASIECSDETTSFYAGWRVLGPRRVFHVVKFTLRGRRYLVEPDDLAQQEAKS